MTTTRVFTHVVRARMLASHLPIVAYVTGQQQIRAAAPKSASFTPALATLLNGWNACTDKTASLNTQEQSLLHQLEATRQARRLAMEQTRLAELAFVSGVQVEAKNDPDVVTSLGLSVQAPKGTRSLTAPEAPDTVTVKPGADPGGLHVSWAKCARAHSYQVQLSVEPVTASSWTTLTPQTRRTLKLGDLTPGAGYQVRVAAVGAAGESAFSAPARGNAR